MAKAVYVFQFPEFLNEVKLAQNEIAYLIEKKKLNLDRHMEIDERIKGLTKLNVFFLVAPDLYQIIKDYAWSTPPPNWTGFRGAPSGASHDVMQYHAPAAVFEGGRVEEIGGYEKQPGVKYYDADFPSLNLEFKWNTAATVEVNTPAKGKVIVPKVSYCLNVHVKRVRTELAQGKLYDY